MSFSSPLYFLLLIPILAWAVLWWYRFKAGAIVVPNTKLLGHLADEKAKYWRLIRTVVRLGLLLILVIALADPQKESSYKTVTNQGIDMMLVVDTSSSMRAEDFEPNNRLYVAKRTMKTFIRNRDYDRIGLVAFSGMAITMCPLTTDYHILSRRIGDVDFEMLDDGTAIGVAIATALNRLDKSDAKSKVMILLTDGENNVEILDPIKAAKMAREMDVKIYTIGVGRDGGAPVPIGEENGKKIFARYPNGKLYLPKLDERTLRQIAAETGGQYFRAVDEIALKEIYDRIDKMEKSDIQTRTFFEYEAMFPWILWLLFVGLMAELLVFNVFLKVWP